MFSFSNNKLVNSAPFKLWLTTCGARKKPWYISCRELSEAPASLPMPGAVKR